ncbi:flagellar basal-body rod protein FlgG [Pseudomonas salomonii]|jgi:flagellar basal-body rod protein FlgG|nr:flagellar basal-body rod protein FlgG [Pseudomonas salomonii]
MFRTLTASILMMSSSLAAAVDAAALSREQSMAVDRYVAAEMTRQGLPGLALGIYRNGRVVLAKGYGLANVELNVPMSADSVLQSGSVGKSFTATAVMHIVGTQKNFSAGSLQTTGQPLDLAVNGRGFFQILQADGTTGYTRDGTFHLNAIGQVVTASGFTLEPAIVVPDNAKTFTVGQDGTVSITVAGNAAAQVIGNLQTADFINPAGLQAIGNNLFLETAASGAPQVGTPGLNGFGTALQRTLETSNVSTVEEMVNMITTQRAYEMNSKVISTANQMLGALTQKL